MIPSIFTAAERRDFMDRGFSRRDLGRLAALVATGTALPFFSEASVAQGLSALRDIPPDATILSSNENPMGPCPEAQSAIHDVIAQGGRYLYRETFAFIDTMAAIEGLPKTHIAPGAGSSDLLHRAVLAFCSPGKSLIVADPGYEAAEKAAHFIGAASIRVPLRKDGSHDVLGMATIDPNAGLIYLCNPNNPTGSVTLQQDVDDLIATKPKGAIILLDEAYIHLARSAVSGVPYVVADKDVIILRTFSKIYGMAGLRAGAAFGRPDLLAQIKGYGAGAMPVTGMVGAIASLKARGLVESRRKTIGEIREDTTEWLDRKGYTVMPSESNKIMVDVKRPGKEVFEALFTEKVVIGRTWPSMPNHVRISIGTRDEMAKFMAAFTKVMA